MRYSTHKPQPGYWCSVKPDFPEGVSLDVDLDLTGRQLRAAWEWRFRIEEKHFEMGVAESVFDASPLDYSEADVIVNWNPHLIAKPNSIFRPGEMHLELTGTGSKQPALVGYGSRIDVKWSALTALVRNTSALSVAMRRPDGTIMYQMEVPTDFIARGDVMIGEATKKMHVLTADFRNSCTYTDDVSPEIIVT